MSVPLALLGLDGLEGRRSGELVMDLLVVVRDGKAGTLTEAQP